MKLLRCPRCGGRLSLAAPLARCAACGPYPLLADVPVLLADPAGYCSAFRESILATLAEVEAADRSTLTVVDAFAEGHDAEPRRFGDDWTRHEALGDDAPTPVRGPAAKALTGLKRLTTRAGPAAWLAEHLGKARVALELGCGAGALSEVLASRVEHLVIADLSLRAVLRARARASRYRAEVTGAVMDAQALAVQPRAIDLLVAEHVVDLLDAPADFFAAAKASLRRGGRLLVTTPEPALGSGDDGRALELAREAGFRLVERQDGLPWLRVNSERFVEVYLVQALELRA
ncbi:MAG: methyltransferase domain-containing protein [Myxococcota bacterium]